MRLLARNEPDAPCCVGRNDATFAEQGHGEISDKIDGAAATQGRFEITPPA
jgi:hypothetical protein